MKRGLAILLCLLLLTACAPNPFGKGFVPTVTVEGDVNVIFELNRESADGFAWTKVENKGETLPCILLADVIAKADPRAETYNLLLIAADGYSVLISGGDLDGAYIAFSFANGWECINLNHPPSSKVKTLQKIIVVAEEGAIGLVDAAGSRLFSAGQLALLPLYASYQLQGRAEQNGNSAEVYEFIMRKPIAELLTAERELAIFGRDGSVARDPNFARAALEPSGNTLDYVFAGGERIADVAGLIADAPARSIAQAHADAVSFLAQDERVLLIILDGWGWEMFARFQNDQPFLADLNPQPALAAYPPLSPVGLATILTGVLPDVHGICDRVNKQPQAPDLFEKARNAAYIEGDIRLILTSLAPELTPGGDDKIFEAAKKNLNADLLVVHFHGLDEAAHDFGPYSNAVAARLRLLDGYVAQLAALWGGKVIVTADHGLHPNGDGGAHGLVCREDMIVPYAVFDGGKP
ncbi:MAG: alkaline phosphatase family protein [Clostridiales bacterium]|nr:alkaline phosphatase family protein [Clostridiales bacterium]